MSMSFGRHIYKFPDTNVINMDETPLCFYKPGSTTVNKKGCREVHVKSTGAEKRRLTVVLVCTAAGDCYHQWLFSRGKGNSRIYASRWVLWSGSSRRHGMMQI